PVPSKDIFSQPLGNPSSRGRKALVEVVIRSSFPGAPCPSCAASPTAPKGAHRPDPSVKTRIPIHQDQNHKLYCRTRGRPGDSITDSRIDSGGCFGKSRGNEFLTHINKSQTRADCECDSVESKSPQTRACFACRRIR